VTIITFSAIKIRDVCVPDENMKGLAIKYLYKYVTIEIDNAVKHCAEE